MESHDLTRESHTDPTCHMQSQSGVWAGPGTGCTSHGTRDRSRAQAACGICTRPIMFASSRAGLDWTMLKPAHRVVHRAVQRALHVAYTPRQSPMPQAAPTVPGPACAPCRIPNCTACGSQGGPGAGSTAYDMRGWHGAHTAHSTLTTGSSMHRWPVAQS